MSTQAHELPDTGRLDIDDAKERLRQVLRQHRRKRHRHPARGHDAVCESLTTHALEAVKGMDRVAASRPGAPGSLGATDRDGACRSRPGGHP